MRRCRKLVARCSTVVSIILLLAGSLSLAFVDFGAARTTRSLAYQLSILLDQNTRKDFVSFLRQGASQNLRSAMGGDPVHLKLGTGTIAAGVIPPLALDARSSASTTGSLPVPHTKPPSKGASRSDVVWLFDQQEGPSLFALSDRGLTVTGFLIAGENTSDQPLTDVEAVLKPDKNADGNIELALGLTPIRRANLCAPFPQALNSA